MTSETEKLNISFYLILILKWVSDLVTRKKILSIYGTIWVCESIFSTVNSINTKYRSGISDETLAPYWRCKIHIGFPRVATKKENIKTSLIFNIDYVLKWKYFVCAYSVTSVMSDSLQPVDCSLPGSSVHGILQARILERVAMPSSRGSSNPRNQTHISCISYIAGGFFTTWASEVTISH